MRRCSSSAAAVPSVASRPTAACTNSPRSSWTRLRNAASASRRRTVRSEQLPCCAAVPMELPAAKASKTASSLSLRPCPLMSSLAGAGPVAADVRENRGAAAAPPGHSCLEMGCGRWMLLRSSVRPFLRLSNTYILPRICSDVHCTIFLLATACQRAYRLPPASNRRSRSVRAVGCSRASNLNTCAWATANDMPLSLVRYLLF
jgi:hypothetical protein